MPELVQERQGVLREQIPQYILFSSQRYLLLQTVLCTYRNFVIAAGLIHADRTEKNFTISERMKQPLCEAVTGFISTHWLQRYGIC